HTKGSNQLWNIMRATYQVLNQTNPSLTESCWLCYITTPPFYEAIASPASAKAKNGTNPPECKWNQTNESPGVTLEQVKGKGLCLG
ncbi:ENV2 protein, partial [Furnarius figulus]|nr:ENV2 protein [Furnarius figulus]